METPEQRQETTDEDEDEPEDMDVMENESAVEKTEEFFGRMNENTFERSENNK